MSSATTPAHSLKGLDEKYKQIILKEREEYLKRKRSSDDSEDNSGSNTRRVTEELCEAIKEMYDKGMTASEIIEVIPVKSENTIYYHLRGDCTHEIRSLVTYDECGWMRYYAKQGAPSRTLGVLYDVDQRVASRHIIGDCSHEKSLEPVSPEQLRKNAYSSTQMATTTCPVCKDDFEHPVYEERTTCSDSCNVKYASMKAHGQI